MTGEAERGRGRTASRWVLPFILILAAAPAAGGEVSTVLSLEAGGLVSYSDLDGWSADGVFSQTNELGFEYFGKASGERGDFLTFDLQTRLSYDPARPDDEPWAIEVHNAWLEYKLGLGQQVRAGHFEPAFGLERAVDTHGTLLQTLAMDAVGAKHDWGVAYRGQLGGADLEVAAQIGSGMGIERKDGSFLATARASTPPGGAFRIGGSLLHGRTLDSMGMRTIPQPLYSETATERTMAGADAEWSAGALDLSLDAAAGWIEDQGAVGGLLQVGAPFPRTDALRVEAQFSAWWEEHVDEEAALSAVVCASYRLTPGWTLRAAIASDRSYGNIPDETRLVFQAYYYGVAP